MEEEEKRKRDTRYTIRRKKVQAWESKRQNERRMRKIERKKELWLHLLFRIARRSGGTFGVEKIVQS